MQEKTTELSTEFSPLCSRTSFRRSSLAPSRCWLPFLSCLLGRGLPRGETSGLTQIAGVSIPPAARDCVIPGISGESSVVIQSKRIVCHHVLRSVWKREMKRYYSGQPAEALQPGLLSNSKVVLACFSFFSCSANCSYWQQKCASTVKQSIWKLLGNNLLFGGNQVTYLFHGFLPSLLVCFQLCILATCLKWGSIDFSCILTRS